MCESKAMGGKRCAAHTRPRFEAAAPGTAEWDEAAAEYARTKQGRERLTALALESVAARDLEGAVAAQQALAAAERAEQAQTEFNERVAKTVKEASSSTDVARLRRLSGNSHPAVVLGVAQNEHTPEDVLLRLAGEGPVEVRAAIAGRRSAPVSVFEKLMRDPDEGVRQRLRAWHNRPSSVIRYWATSENGSERSLAAAYAGSRACPDAVDVLEGLASDSDRFVRIQVAKNEAAPLAVLRRLTDDDDVMVATQPASNPALPDADVEALVRARSWEIKGAEFFVRNALRQRLSRMGRADLIALITPADERPS